MSEYTTPTEKRGPDGLTKAERQTLRDPYSYAVQQINPCRWLVGAKECMADFDVVIGYGRWVRLVSNTGTRLEMTIGELCPCEAKQHRPSDRCKHEAVLTAVLLDRAGQGEAA